VEQEEVDRVGWIGYTTGGDTMEVKGFMDRDFVEYLMESGKYEGVWSRCITRRNNSLYLEKIITRLENCHGCVLREISKVNTEHPQCVYWRHLKMKGTKKGKEGRWG
jgi:hypothetical protein